jgi:hypothetical protein
MEIPREFDALRPDIVRLLKLANERGKFALSLAANPDVQIALEWMQENRWVELIDVCHLASSPDSHRHAIYRVFRLTTVAIEWKAAMR